MSVIAKASNTINKLSSVRGCSAELPDQAQSCLPTAEGEAGIAVSEQTPLPSEHGVKRRRHSDETPRPSTKFRAAGTLQHTKCLLTSALMVSKPHEVWYKDARQELRLYHRAYMVPDRGLGEAVSCLAWGRLHLTILMFFSEGPQLTPSAFKTPARPVAPVYGATQ